MQVEEVVLPAGLKVIGPRTFRKFSKMKKINLPNTLVKLGEGCFTGCGSLDLEKLPEGLKTIEGSDLCGNLLYSGGYYRDWKFCF